MDTPRSLPINVLHSTVQPVSSGDGRRQSRSQNLHLEIGLATTRSPATNIDISQKSSDPVLTNNIHISGSRSDTSSRCSTPTPSITSSTDDSSIATPTLETATPPTFTFSPPDNSTRLLLRDRYLESQRPIIVGSKIPLDIPRSVYQESKQSSDSLLSVFTPPETPASAKGKQSSKLDQSIPPPKFALNIKPRVNGGDFDTIMGIDSKPREPHQETGILKPTGSYELDDPVRPTKFGSGAWSNVYKGYLKESASDEKPLLIAIKTPLNSFSTPAIRREAEILSFVQRKVSESSQYQSIIPFHGFDQSTDSILMTAFSGENLEQFTSRCRTSQPSNASFNSRKLPIVGITQWLLITERLVGALSFLKANGIIHGDIKPQNILTKAWEGQDSSKYNWISSEEATNLIEPIVSDFSSAYIVDSDGNISDDEDPISAVTTIYCAPELLAAFLTPPTTPTKTNNSSTNSSANENGLAPPKRNEPRPLPTFSSDLYGLCMTFLQCAIGSHPYAGAKMEIQRNIWVRQGDPLSFARSDERVFRCKVGGAVDRLLKGCFGKTSEGRTEIAELGSRINTLCQEWADRKGQDAWVWGA